MIKPLLFNLSGYWSEEFLL